MKINELVEGAIKETISFPVLFAPFFFSAFLNAILGSDRAISALGPGWSIVLRILVLLLLTPLTSGMTIFLDRNVYSGESPNLTGSFDRVKPNYLPLIAVNLVAWTAIVLGFFLFIVPGVYLYVKLIFTNQEVLLGRKTDITKALESSWNHTTNRWGDIFRIILIFEVPLLLISFSLGALPPGWGATVSLLLTTVFQTWVTLVLTHVYLGILEEG
ncbi:hypothetical protein K9M78_01205 [Candidatus Bipolaricaulota bacterium]|nr:hypothetical protein [Candidatus Bipolaricaulota bacterium]